MIYNQSRVNPDRVRKELLALAKQELPSDYIDEHFTPDYNPWDERLCLIPDNDLFEAIKADKVSIVTNTIEGFTENGLELTGGEVLEAERRYNRDDSRSVVRVSLTSIRHHPRRSALGIPACDNPSPAL